MATIPRVNQGDVITAAAWNNLATEIEARVQDTGDTMTGALRINNNLTATGTTFTSSLVIVDAASGNAFTGNSINMANNIEGATKWLHIGGITDTDNVRRIALFANRTYISERLGIGAGKTNPLVSLDVEGTVRADSFQFDTVTGNSMNFSRSDTELTLSLGSRGFVVVGTPALAYTFQIGHHSLLLNSGGGASYFFNKKFSVNQDGNVEVTGKIIPSAGAGANNGIVFPLDAFGGSGDKASIQYITRGGESTSLQLKIENDVDDNIEFSATGQVTSNRSITVTSDERLKENIEPLKYGLEAVKQLEPVAFDWKNRKNKKKTLGLIAQKVANVIDEAIYENKRSEEYTELSLTYDALIPVLINAVKELDQKVEALLKVNKSKKQ